MVDEAPNPLVRVRGLRMAFGGVEVVKGVDLELRPGEVHAIMGENGAGKSTVAKVVAGVYRPTGGTVEVFGERAEFASPRAALERGIALIHQEPLTFPDLTVAENVFVGHLPTAGGRVDWRTMRERADGLLRTLGANFDARRLAGGLSVADQQTVELAAALAHDARVLLMDETTAALTPKEASELFAVVRRLRDEGRAIAFVSHRLDEIFAISDRITVMRDGEKVAELLTRETDAAELVRLMVGREVASSRVARRAPTAEPALRVSGLSRAGRFEGVSFEVRPGEIVGLAGLVGAGRTEVCQAIFGAAPPTAGTVELLGRPYVPKDPREAVARGLAMVPEDRARDGLLLPLSIADNAVLPSLRGAWTRPKAERKTAEEATARLRTALWSVEQPVGQLSGGNQQKVVLAKWMLTGPKVLILDEPTRGVDVGAKEEVHRLIRELADSGIAVLLVSSDLPEVLDLSDRVLVMREGRLVGEFAGDAATPEGVMGAASGVEGGGFGVEGSEHTPPSTLHPPLRTEWGVLAMLLLVVVATALKQPRFLGSDSLGGVLLTFPLLAVMGMGQMPVVVTRGIDVSVGSIVGVAGIVVGMTFRANPGMPIPVGLLEGLGVGLVLGGLNALVIALGRVPPIVATLGTLSAYRGLAYVVSGGKQVASNELPDALVRLAGTGSLLIALVVAGLAAFFVSLTRAGRDVFALGGNPNAARLRGVPVMRTNALVYLLSGALAGLTGVLYAARFGSVSPGSAGQGMELGVIAAVVVGGTRVTGGSGSVGGVLLGCLLLATIAQALAVLGIDATWQGLAYGLVILVALLLGRALRGREA